MTNVSFNVQKIEDANKEGCAVITLNFFGSDKVYSYVRKYNFDSNTNLNFSIIDGCKVSWDANKENIAIERVYETKGFKKMSSENQVGKNGKVSEKIKNELEGKKLIIPQVAKPIENVEGEVHHDRYEEIKCCLECGIPVYLAGPAGSGKNFTVEQIAKELGWDFYFSNSVQQEYKLTGFIDAGGKFHDTEFYKACTSDKDCVFFLDEMDASIPEVLVLLNAAIANGYFEFPNGRVDFDKVHFVAAGNTVGSGADDMYTGRMVLDQATLDRFAIIEFDYCLNIELSITKNNVELVEFIHQLRDKATENGIRATFSYRCMTMLTKLEAANMDIVMALKICVVKGLDKDTINTLTIEGCSKYHDALKKVQEAA